MNDDNFAFELKNIAKSLGLADGVRAAVDDDDTRTLGHYERLHFGLGDFDDDLPVLIRAMTINLDRAAFARINDACWHAYVDGFNQGVRAILPKAKEAGED